MLEIAVPGDLGAGHQHHCLVPSPHSRGNPKHSHCSHCLLPQGGWEKPNTTQEKHQATASSCLTSVNPSHPQETPLTKGRELLPLYPLPKDLVQLGGLGIGFSWALPQAERHSSTVRELGMFFQWICSLVLHFYPQGEGSLTPSCSHPIALCQAWEVFHKNDVNTLAQSLPTPSPPELSPAQLKALPCSPCVPR